ncbi:MAG: hypothetical protein EOO20_16220 [Chryseobacterium sp.]|nr:MAG: hypothetical protein EOO20_16220 [Chryseobacterium sp.]
MGTIIAILNGTKSEDIIPEILNISARIYAISNRNHAGSSSQYGTDRQNYFPNTMPVITAFTSNNSLPMPFKR